MSSATVLVLAAVLLILALAGVGAYRLRRGCCGNCADCGNCRSAPINIKEEDE